MPTMLDRIVKVTALSVFLLTAYLFPIPAVLAQETHIWQTEAEQASQLYQQGIEHYRNDKLSDALESFKKALKIYQQLGDLNSEGLTLNYLGLVYVSLSQYTQGVDFYQQALAKFRDLKNQWNEGVVLNNIARVYHNLGQYAQALNFYEQTLIIRKQVNDKEGEASTLGNLAQTYLALGEYSEALNLLNQALLLTRKLSDPIVKGRVLNLLGLYYRNLGEYPEALKYYQEALKITQQLRNRNAQASVVNNIGDIYLYQGKYDQALRSFKQSLLIFRDIADPFGEGTILGNIGRVYANWGKYPQALEFFDQALLILTEIGDRAGQGRNLKNIGAILYQSGSFLQAEKNLYAAIDVLDSLRLELNHANKVSIFETQLDAYRILQQSLIAQNKISTALEVSERGRARAFIELLNTRLSNRDSITQFYPADQPSISLIQKIAKQQNATLVQYSIIPDNFQIGDTLESRESEIYIWVIKPTGEITFRKTDLKPLWQRENINLSQLVTTSRLSIGVRGINISANQIPNTATTKERFRRLHELLIEPIADLLPTNENQRVIFVPQDSLFLVPFPALQDKEGKYLIEKHTILTAPSIQVLDLTRQQKLRNGELEGSREVLVVGNPTMPEIKLAPNQPPQQLSNLKWAEQEAKNIASLLKTQALIGDQATKEAIRNKITQAQIIHFATHGLFNDTQGLASAIALAPSHLDQGFLTAGEIIDMKLKAKLVVLSACDTGRGKITGDGVIGLSRAFISAGVPSVIVSLWAVDDNSTSVLMTEFYQNLQQNPDKATALRQAMLTTMKTHPSPKYWAAFTLIGES
jgi:CHAT domain-containing protein/Tfp pilus assembly protein PilF